MQAGSYEHLVGLRHDQCKTMLENCYKCKLALTNAWLASVMTYT